MAALSSLLIFGLGDVPVHGLFSSVSVSFLLSNLHGCLFYWGHDVHVVAFDGWKLNCEVESLLRITNALIGCCVGLVVLLFLRFSSFCL